MTRLGVQKGMEEFFKKFNVELPHNPAIPLLGTDPNELETGFKQKLVPTFTAALSQQPEERTNANPRGQGRIRKTWYIHMTQQYSATEKHPSTDTCSTVDGP